MPHDMVHEVLLPGEALLADVAAMRGLAGVLADVVHHVLLAGERFRAELTSGWNGIQVRFVCSQDST